MKNLFQTMFEEPEGDPPEIEPVADATDDTDDTNEPPEITPVSTNDPPDTSSSESFDDNQQYDDNYQDGTNSQSEEDNTTLDEKGEIFAKVSILKEYRSLYSKIDDTLVMIDKIDLVQVGNNIKSNDISNIKDKLSELMQDIYTTIVYEFQLQYKNLKVKMVEYSSRYVILAKSLVNLIKKDQK